MLRALLYFFLIYLGYQFIFKFLIPVFRTTQQVRKGIREMSTPMNQSDGNQRMNEFAKAEQNSSSSQTRSADKSSKEPTGDYIDFEEVK